MRKTYSKLTGFEESFIGDAVRRNPHYGFVPHFKYFLKNKERWSNADGVLARILAPVPDNSDEAWETWRQYRSAQAEITSIFLIENYLCGEVIGLEVARPGVGKSCDIYARFISGIESYLEVKAQSGQQHGDKHPLSRKPIGFAPQFEEDLRSWLFEKRLSSRNGKSMTPYCRQASDKGADVLISMIDIFRQGAADIISLGKLLAPDHGEITSKDFPRKGAWRWLPVKSASMRVFTIEAGNQTSEKMVRLKEVWVFDNARLSEMLVLRARMSDAILAREYLTSSSTGRS